MNHRVDDPPHGWCIHRRLKAGLD